jgi:hypothetical protein
MGLCAAIAHALRTWLAGLFLSVTATASALASQGPGTGRGTASAAAQLTMAVVIYGGVALITAASLAVALKHRFSKH